MRKKRTPRGPIFAVVDLETTGTSVKDGDRIIQIGCVLVQDSQVINRFATKLNPCQQIPAAISQLTGIRDRDVKDAPLFEDIAPTLTGLLADTIFVAHNVYFDFPYLNAELTRVGEEPLQIPAIDTVALSQLLLPTAQSFRLRDLCAQFKIGLDHPHSAVADAEATADLLVALLKRVHQLPTPTLKQLVNLNLKLPMQTGLILTRELASRKTQPVPLTDEYYLSHGLVLHKKRPLATPTATPVGKYPMQKRQKLRLYDDQLDYRPTQAKMMNAIYNYFTRDGAKQVLLEAGTGVGKTLGYLLPLAYLAGPNDKLILAPPTNLLQHQLQAAVTQLNRLVPQTMQAVLVKGSRHYLSLGRFVHSLSRRESSQLTQLTKAQLLVWLLSTETGDLDEINFSPQAESYLTEVRHPGLANLSGSDPFYRDDFLVHRDRQLQLANVVIVNQAYLVAHAAELGRLAPQTWLVVDEAQHLSRNVLKSASQQVSFAHLHQVLNQLQPLVNPEVDANLVTLFQGLPVANYNLELVANDLVEVKKALADLEASLATRLDQSQATAAIAAVDLAILLDDDHPVMAAFHRGLRLLQRHFAVLQQLFDRRSDRWLPADRYLIGQFKSGLAELVDLANQLHRMRQLAKRAGDRAFFGVSPDRGTGLQLDANLLLADHFLSEQVYTHFSRQLFVGATLFSSRRSAYIYDQLDLDQKQVKVKRLPAAFDYEHAARLLIASDAPVPEAATVAGTLDYLAQAINDLVVATDCQTLVLFNSLANIEEVYQRLHGMPIFDQRDIIAQGISGSRAKLLKQFKNGHNAVLLGAGSFWEGVDLPAEQLQLLVVTRLPFGRPDDLETQAKASFLRANGKSPFYHDALPQATLRLRQGLGRLLRTPTDRGVMVVLDPRLATQQYGQRMQKALPKELTKQVLPTNQLVPAASEFLAADPEND